VSCNKASKARSPEILITAIADFGVELVERENIVPEFRVLAF
jgi:hypothetical protein